MPLEVERLPRMASRHGVIFSYKIWSTASVPPWNKRREARVFPYNPRNGTVVPRKRRETLMIGIKRSIIMAVTGAALVVSSSLGAISAPAVSSATSFAPATAASGSSIVEVKYNHHNGGGRRYHRGHHGGYNNFWWGAPLLAAPFLYNGYNDWGGDYRYSGYGYRYGGSNSCYRHCRYDHGPRFCRYHWEDYC